MSEGGIFIFNGGSVSDEELQLGQPDETEAVNLPHHVARCAMRYRLFTRRQAAQSKDIQQVKYMMVCLIALILFTSPQARAVVEWIHKQIL